VKKEKGGWKAQILKLKAGLFKIKRPRKRKEVRSRTLAARKDYNRSIRGKGHGP